MAVRISLFGKLAELLGRELEISDEFCGRPLTAVRQFLAGEYPGAADDLLSPRVRACANDVLVADDHIVTDGEQLALLPPVSGG